MTNRRVICWRARAARFLNNRPHRPRGFDAAKRTVMSVALGSLPAVAMGLLSAADSHSTPSYPMRQRHGP